MNKRASILLTFFGLVFAAAGATFYVSPSGSATPPFDTWARAARHPDPAYAAAGSGDIIWVAPGTYAITNPASLVTLDKSVVLKSSSGAGVTLLDGGHPVVTNGGLTVLDGLIDGFTIQRFSKGLILGGGVVQNCIIRSNNWVGVEMDGGTGLLRNCGVILNNGGGVEMHGGLVESCVISGNVQRLWSGGGGVFFQPGEGGTVRRSTIRNNTATNGGGVYMDTATCRVEHCMIRDNTALESGGGVYVQGGALLAGHRLENCVIARNAATLGGGVYATDGCFIDACTIADNTAGTGGGLRFFDTALAGTGSIVNTVIYSNTASSEANCAMSVSNYGVTYSCTIPKPANADATVFTNAPRWINGSQLNYRLSAGSPCIDAGFTQSWMPGGIDVYRGTRVVASAVDIGADEFGHVPNDFNGDGRGDLVVFHSAAGNWYVRSLTGGTLALGENWGFAGCVPATSWLDTGTGVAQAVFHPASGQWYVKKFHGAVAVSGLNCGFSGCVPVYKDYGGGGAGDVGVYDPAAGNWYIPGLLWGVNWGFPGCRPVAGDYDGNGMADLAVFDMATGNWYVKLLNASGGGVALGDAVLLGVNWGFGGCVPVPGDYDGDGVWDLAVFDAATGNWYIRTVSGASILFQYNWGFNGCTPVAGDFDGDGAYDLAVYHAATGNWYIRSLNGTVMAAPVNWGWNATEPVGL